MSLREPGVPPRNPFSHPALFYRDDTEYLAGTIPFILAGRAAGELAANSCLHGGGGGTARLWSEDGQVVCEVRDAGTIVDPLAGRRPAYLSPHGGRGILLVNHLADLVRVHTGPDGTAIRVYLRKRAGRPAAES